MTMLPVAVVPCVKVFSDALVVFHITSLGTPRCFIGYVRLTLAAKADQTIESAFTRH